MTTTVYFDLDGTLLDYTTTFPEMVTETLPGTVTDEMVETYSGRLLAALDDCADDPYVLAFEVVCEEFALDASAEDLAADFIQTEVDATDVPDSVHRLVERVAARHRTGVLTNGDGAVQRRKLAAHGLDAVVDAVVVSNDLGVRKPEPGIFHAARDRLPADTHVYIGDSYAEDIVPAREQGFRTVYVGEEEERPDVPVAADGTEALAGLLLPLLDDSR